MNLADNLKKIRKENNLSQEQLAEKLGVSRQSVSKWESGISYPEMDKVIQICNIFNLNINELINEDIKQVNEDKEIQVRNNKYITSFFEYITKTIDMFSSMKFKQKLKCLFEQCVISLILCVLLVIIGSVGQMLVWSILNLLPDILYYPIYNLLSTLYIIVALIVGTIILLHIFKIRYLDYYEIVREKKEEEPIEEVITEVEAKKVEEKETKKQKIILEKKKEQVVIRDPKHSEYNFFTAVGKILLWFVKLMASIVLCCFVFTFIALVMCLPISFLLFESGLLFVGLLMAIVGAVLINIIILKLIFNFIVCKKNNKSFLFAASIISLIVFGFGVGTVCMSATSFDVEEKEYELVESSYVFDMSDDILINDWEYYDTDVEYIEQDIDDIQIVIKHSDLYDVHMWNHEGTINMAIYTNELNILEYLRLVVKDLNHKIIRVNDYQTDIVVYANKNNLNKIKKNRENYDYRIADLEESLYDTMADYREVSTELDRLRELIINSDVEVIIDNDGKIIGISKYKKEIE